MYLSFLLILCVSIQWCGGCWHSDDCLYELVPSGAPVQEFPRFDNNQKHALSQLYEKLKGLSWEELLEAVNNITEPPIQLTPEQSYYLYDHYPGYFKRISRNPQHENSIVYKKEPTVCGRDPKTETPILAITTSEELVLVFQMEDFNQEFYVYLCSERPCPFWKFCECMNKLLYKYNAVVVNLNGTSPHIDTILLYNCAAYMTADFSCQEN